MDGICLCENMYIYLRFTLLAIIKNPSDSWLKIEKYIPSPPYLSLLYPLNISTILMASFDYNFWKEKDLYLVINASYFGRIFLFFCQLILFSIKHQLRHLNKVDSTCLPSSFYNWIFCNLMPLTQLVGLRICWQHLLLRSKTPAWLWH